MPVKIVEVEGFENFMKTIREQETEAGSKNIPLIVIVKASNQPDGKCWCPDCVLRMQQHDFRRHYFDKMLSSKLDSMKVNGIMVKGKVGTLEEWMNLQNKFKTDDTLRLKALPSAFVWKDGRPQKRLEPPDIMNPEKFKALFAQ